MNIAFRHLRSVLSRTVTENEIDVIISLPVFLLSRTKVDRFTNRTVKGEGYRLFVSTKKKEEKSVQGKKR